MNEQVDYLRLDSISFLDKKKIPDYQNQFWDKYDKMHNANNAK